MATLSAWRFDSSAGAEEATRIVQELSRAGVVPVLDVATVSWADGAARPTTRQVREGALPSTLGVEFWALLFGLIFLVPLLGAAVGSAAGARAGTLSDVGIDDGFIHKVRDQVTPGTSALFLHTADAAVDRLRPAFEGSRAELIVAQIGSDQEQALREVFEATS